MAPKKMMLLGFGARLKEREKDSKILLPRKVADERSAPLSNLANLMYRAENNCSNVRVAQEESSSTSQGLHGVASTWRTDFLAWHPPSTFIDSPLLASKSSQYGALVLYCSTQYNIYLYCSIRLQRQPRGWTRPRIQRKRASRKYCCVARSSMV